MIILTLEHYMIIQTNQKYTKYAIVIPVGFCWNQTLLAGLVTILGHSDVSETPHFTPPCHVPMWFYYGEVESLPNVEVAVTF